MNILACADLHTGHNRVPIAKCSRDIEDFLLPKITDDVDLMVIAGDYCHRLMDLDGGYGAVALMLANEIIDRCLDHGVLLRVLKGTFEHDRRQIRIFTLRRAIESIRLHGVQQIRAVDTLEVETISGLNINVLYWPDDLPYENPGDRAEDMINSLGIDKVDITVHHGYCDHLVPEEVRGKITNYASSEQLRRITKGWIINGHVHTPSVQGRIVSCGSFFRTRHGEPEDKGFFMLTMDADGAENAEFVRNERATPFVTVDVTEFGDDAVAARNKLVTVVEKLRPKIPDDAGAYVRAIVANPVTRQHLALYAAEHWPDIHLTPEGARRGKGFSEEEERINAETDFGVKLTPDNLANEISRELNGKLKPDRIKSLLSTEK